jgi:hypothetical protein
VFDKIPKVIKCLVLACSIVLFSTLFYVYIDNSYNIFVILKANNLYKNFKDIDTVIGVPQPLPINNFFNKINDMTIISPAMGISSNKKDNTIICNGNGLTDAFDSQYNLTDGQTSPNGKWQNIYAGYGLTGVEKSGDKNVFYLKPKPVTSIHKTLAALVQSTDKFCDLSLNLDVKTVKQLRENDPANTWESAWVFFRYTDHFHYYWFTISADGIELGKKDCDSCKDSYYGQQPLVTKKIPSLKLNTWQHWLINLNGNHIQISVDNQMIIDYIDEKMSPKLSSGAIAMYSEDAYVQYDNVKLLSK